MRGASTGHPRSRPCFGRKTLRRCRNSEEADDVVLIDVDSDDLDDVIVIDVPDSLPKKRQGSSILRKDTNVPLQTVIYIDDDESLDKFNSFVGASSSRSFKPPAEDYEDVDDEENPFIQENVTPVRLSKCRRTYSGKASPGKGYGLNLDSENISSANDHPDCELMEDIYGTVQEQWEKAFYRRRKVFKVDQSGLKSHNGASRILNDGSDQTVGRKSANDKHMEAPDHFRTGKFSDEDEGTSLSEEDIAYYDSTYISVGDSRYRGQHSPSIQTELEDHQYFEPGNSSFHNWKRFRKSPSYSSRGEQAAKEVKKTKSRVIGDPDYVRDSSVKDDVAIRKCRSSAEVEADPVSFSPTHEVRESQVTATGCVNQVEHLKSCAPHESGNVEKAYDLTSVRSSFMSSTVPDKQRNCSFILSSDAIESVSGESSWFQNSSLGSRDVIKKGCHGENRTTFDVMPSSRLDEFVSNNGEEDKHDDFHPENGHAMGYVESCMLGEREKLKETDEYKRALEEEWASRQQALKIQAEEAQNLRRLQKRNKDENGHTIDSVESCMVGEREKFKETDEYKRAMEEEWASRQQALKIQAEEAQHLRRLEKRRKAENMRLMDMERRQKQRIEEMRSTQKKDEEYMNLKEVTRAEVIKELNKLEMACQNMASLLHSLGIQIEGWPSPSPQEVQTAYKKALLTFHPDRALGSDIRLQVEAEEKFKVINRFKEKFSPVV